MKIGICSLFLICCLLGCSSHPNSSLRRQRYAFNTRYNIYYNAKQLFEINLKQLEHSNTDSIYGLEKPFDEVIIKCKKAIQLYSIQEKPLKKPGWKKDPKKRAFQNQTEYNPFLVNCWLLMGKAYFYNKEYEKALRTFSYTARNFKNEKDKYREALLWEAHTHIQQQDIFPAEHLLKTIDRKQLKKKDKKLYDRSVIFINKFPYHLPEVKSNDTISTVLTANRLVSYTQQDSLYRKSYMAYQNHELKRVKEICKAFYNQFPDDPYTPLFLYLEAFSLIPGKDVNGFRAKLTEITAKYPSSPLSEISGRTLSLLDNGNKLSGEYIPLPDMYGRLIPTNYNTTAINYENENESPYHILILYTSPDITEEELLFNISSFNFTYILEKQLDTEIRWIDNKRQILIKGFSGKREAEVYKNKIGTLPGIFGLTRESEIVLVKLKK